MWFFFLKLLFINFFKMIEKNFKVWDARRMNLWSKAWTNVRAALDSSWLSLITKLNMNKITYCTPSPLPGTVAAHPGKFFLNIFRVQEFLQNFFKNDFRTQKHFLNIFKSSGIFFRTYLEYFSGLEFFLKFFLNISWAQDFFKKQFWIFLQLRNFLRIFFENFSSSGFFWKYFLSLENFCKYFSGHLLISGISLNFFLNS